MELGEYDESGRAKPVPVPGSELAIEADMVLSAIGYRPDLSCLPGDGLFERNRDGTLQADPVTMATAAQGVFAAGDMVIGASTVVEAMAGGYRAAISIDRYLKGQDLYKDRVYRAERRADVAHAEDEAGKAGAEKGRSEMARLPAGQRVKSFAEVNTGFGEEGALCEAKRCLRCDLERRRDES
jgi:NADPH-dependent glutamate synthase beta subunit-like oxidoreductase